MKRRKMKIHTKIVFYAEMRGEMKKETNKWRERERGGGERKSR